MRIRSLLWGLAALVVAAASGPAGAQAWPNKPVKIIVTMATGTPPDVLARAMAQRLQQRLGQTFMVENKPGANNMIGMQACGTSAPDGYTWCITTNDSVSVNPHLFRKLTYDPDKGFAPVAILAWPHSVIVASADSGVKSLKDAVSRSKEKPGSINWASFGVGSSSHLYLELIRSRTGWDVTHVPFREGMVPAVLSNQAQLTYFAIGALKAHIDSGKLVPLAVAGLQRSPYLPEVPTFSEVGLGEYFIRTWFGMFAPAGTPEAVVQEMNRAAVAIVNDGEFRTATLAPLTLSPGHESVAEMKAYLVKDRAVGAELVRTANVRLD